MIPPGVSPRHRRVTRSAARASRWCSSSARCSTAGGFRSSSPRSRVATADLPDARLVIVGDEPHLAAQDLDVGRGARTASADRVEVRSYVDDEELAIALQPRVGVRVPVRVRGLRADAARGARRGRARSWCSIRRWRARSTGPRRPTCLPAADVTDTAALISAAARRQRRNERDAPARRRRAGSATRGTSGRRERWRASNGRAAAVTMTPPKLSIVIVSFNTRAGSRALPRVADGAARLPSRTRSSSSTTRRRDGSVDAVRRALAGRAGRRAGAATPASRPPTTSASGHRPATLVLLLNSDCVVPAGAIDRAGGAAARTSRRGRRRAAAGRRHRPDRAVVRPDDFAAGRAAAESRGALPTSRGVGPAVALGGSRRLERAVRGLGQRRRPARLPRATPRRPACSTSATSSTRRTSTSAPPSARAAGGSCSRRRRRSPTCAAARARPFRAR